MGLLSALPTMVFSQTNLSFQGGEYSIAGAIPGDQLRSAVAIGASGGFVVWDDNATDPSGLGVSIQRLNAGHSPVGLPFRINQTLGLNQQNARVVLLNNGGACVVWESGGPGSQNVIARFVDASGAFTTDEVLVNQPAAQTINQYTTNWVLMRNNKPRPKKQKIRELLSLREEFNVNPGVITLGDGSLVVVYSSSRKVSMQKGLGLSERIDWDPKKSILVTNRTRVPVNYDIDHMQDVYIQRLSSTGAKLGNETVVNTGRTFNQRNGSLAALSGGGFVVVWINEVPGAVGSVSNFAGVVRGGRVDVYARVFSSDGLPVAQEFRVNTATLPCGAPVASGRLDGGFTVAWVQRDAVRTNGLDVLFRSFDGSASPEGAPVIANSRLYGDQFAPVITTIGDKQLLVWSSLGQDGSWEGVYGRVLQGASVAGEEFRINTTTRLRQVNPSVAGHGDEAVVVWSGYAFNNGFDLFAQRVSTP